MATTAESRTERIEEQLKGTPAKPGVYLFRGPKDAVLYVGKAKSLRSRVRSYFRGGDSRPGLENLTARVGRIGGIGRAPPPPPPPNVSPHGPPPPPAREFHWRMAAALRAPGAGRMPAGRPG